MKEPWCVAVYIKCKCDYRHEQIYADDWYEYDRWYYDDLTEDNPESEKEAKRRIVTIGYAGNDDDTINYFIQRFPNAYAIAYDLRPPCNDDDPGTIYGDFEPVYEMYF